MKRISVVLFLICTYSIGYSIHNDKHVIRSLECMGVQDYECAAKEIPLIKHHSVRDSISSVFADSLTMRMDSYYSAGELDKCIYYRKLILFVLKKTKGQLSEDYLFEEEFLAMDYTLKNDFLTAIQIYEQVLKEVNELKAEKEIKDMLYEISYRGLGLAYRGMKIYDKAEENCLKSLTIIEEYFGKDSKDYYDVSYNLFYIYRESGNNKKSISCGIDNAKYCRTAYGEHSLQYGESLQFLSVSYALIGDYVNAEPLAKQALEIYQSSYGDSTKIILELIFNLSAIYTRLANYELAEQYALHAADIAKHRYGENNPLYPVHLVNIGRVYKSLGDATKAEPYFLEAIEWAKKNSDIKTLCFTIFELAEFYTAIGLYEDAETRYKECINVLPSDYEDLMRRQIYANIINSLGGVYFHIGEYEKAEDCYLRSNQINFPIEGEDSHNYGVFCNNMGLLYIELAKFDQAEKYLLKALGTLSLFYNDSHPTYLITLNNLGLLYFTMGQYEKAEYYYTKVLEARSKIHVGLHPDYLFSIYKLGLLKSTTHDFKEAYAYFQKYAKSTKEYYIKGVDFMSEFQRVQYWNATHEKFENGIAGFIYNYSKNDNKANSFAYDNVLFINGLLLNTSNMILNSIFRSGDTILIQQWKELSTIKQQMMVLERESSCPEYLNQLREKAEKLEKEIIRSSAVYRENQRQWNITWDSVRAELKPNQVAIEYMVAPLNGDSTMYCALLLRDTCSYPVMIPLFEEKEVAALINTEVDSATNRTYSYNFRGKLLSQKVWEKVRPYINHGETVFFAPSGILHQLSIEALPYDETQTMADVYNLVRLSSTREIVLGKATAQHSTATLYGGIQYDLDSTKMATESKKYPDVAVTRSLDTDTLDRGGIKPLPWTEKEVENIHAMLQQNNLQAKVYTAINANEESFKALSGKHQNILHIATHGFFWSDSTAQKREYFSQRMTSMDRDMSTLPSIDPLNRCGLLFAGAQLAWSGHRAKLPEGVQDGILTAKEISLLDLRDADLVVLSACETGKGEITGDGVFGLQRAFKMAGAKTIIMSLWPVNDAATQLLMTEFYRNWITKHQSKREAFRNAQNAVRAKMEEPVYWAGFVMLD